MIRVCDAIMGSGKSSAAITYMNEHKDKKFIYITPYLEEAARIKAACPGLHFIEPSKKISEYGFSKVNHTQKLLEDGCNVATTHQAFSYYTQEILDIIRKKEYILIIDESVGTLEKLVVSTSDIKILEESGYLREDDCKYVPTGKEYQGGAFGYIFRLLKSRKLYEETHGEGKGFYYWMLPPELLQGFSDVYILTYMFEAQDLHHLLEIHKIPYNYIGVIHDSDGMYRFSDDRYTIPGYTCTLSERIHIFDNKKLNSIGDSHFAISLSWFRKNGKSAEDDKVSRLKKNINNYYRYFCGDNPSNLRMWGTFGSVKNSLQGLGYTKGFVVFNERGTNKYRDRRVLVYAANIFMNTTIKHFYEGLGVKIDDDIYALSTMVQWIWRSAIRDGKDIQIYIPSKRMRSLLINWIQDVENKYKEYEQASGRDRLNAEEVA